MDISPDKQNIDRVFSNTTYFIDFYQRQYKWNEAPVERLLEDVFYKFNEEYTKFKDNDTSLDQLINKYSWYYLNTYVTNVVEGKLFIVDGQQRLTTITLVLIKLMHLAKVHKSNLEDWLKSKITGHSGFKKEFWLSHDAHKHTLQALFDGKELDKINTDAGITSVNMVSNYGVISKWIDKEIKNKPKYEAFVFYFLNRLVLINLNVEQTEVPMVFEVISDRGVRLKPYEILKGKLLGQIDKQELTALKINEIWDQQVNGINANKEDEIDQFFIYFLKAKLADTSGTAIKFDKDYHRSMFDDEFNIKLQLKHNPKEVKRFLQQDFKYFTNLYTKIWNYINQFDESQKYIYYNRLTDMGNQFLLILSCCTFNDPEEDEKIFSISKQLDRLFCLLQLQRSYSSQTFSNEIYKLSSEIRGKKLADIEKIFDKYLLLQLSTAKGTKVDTVLSYGSFKETGIELEKRFKRYFFARIDSFIAENTKMNMKQSLYDLVMNTGAKNGFHIEHILSHNAENKKLFNNDDEYFERERNRLGGLLLLKGQDNISSNNE